MDLKLYYPTQGARVYRTYLNLLGKDDSLPNIHSCGLADFLLLLNAYMVRFQDGDSLLLTVDDLALLLHTTSDSIPAQLTQLVKAGLLGYRIVEENVYELAVPDVERFLPPRADATHSPYYVLSAQFLKKLDRMTFGKRHSRLDCLLDLWLHTIWNVPEHPVSSHLPIFWSADCCDDNGFVDIHKLGERWGYNSTLAQINFTWLFHYVENHYEPEHRYLLVPRCVQRLYTSKSSNKHDYYQSLSAALREVRHEH